MSTTPAASTQTERIVFGRLCWIGLLTRPGCKKE